MTNTDIEALAAAKRWMCALPRDQFDNLLLILAERREIDARAALRSTTAEPVEAAEGELPPSIGGLHLSGKRASGERMCADGHVVPEGHALYWPQSMGQYDDSDPYCLTHAIEKSESEQGWPTDSAAKDAEIAELREHIRDLADDMETRIKDGIELGAAVWRITLEDAVAESRLFLAALANRGETGALAKELGE